MTKRKAIVIGNNHDNTLNVIRALGQAGYDPVVLLVSPDDKNYILKSRYVNTFYIVSNEVEAKEFLLSKSELWGLPAITTYDKVASVLDEEFSSLSQHYKLPNCNERNLGIVKEMDKARMNDVAKIAGMNIPQTTSITQSTFNPNFVNNFTFPVILKPETSANGSKEDFRICSDLESLKTEISLLNPSASFLIQEFIPNDEVLLVAGCVTADGKNHAYGHINKSKHGKHDSNLGMNSFGYLTSEPVSAEQINKYLSLIGYTGPYSFEFIRHDNTIYFIEVNLRTDGLYFFYTKAGVNIPALWMDSFYGNNITLSPAPTKVYGMCEFQYIKNFVRPKNILSNLKDLLSTDVFSIASLKDPKPFLYKFIYH